MSNLSPHFLRYRDYIGHLLSGRLAKKEASEAQLRKMQDSLSLMGRKLVVLRDAEEKAQRGT